MAAPVPFHRLAHPRSAWKPVAEVAIVVVWWAVGVGVPLGIVMLSAGVKELTELDNLSSLAITLGMLACMTPVTLLVARLFHRPIGLLSSVAGRLRWRWLARCTLLGLLINAGWVTLLLGAELMTRGQVSLSWPGWGTFGAFAAVVIILAPLQSTGEEYFFRGTLLQAIGSYARSPWIAIALTSVAFMAIHGAGFEASVALLGMGVAAGWLTIRSGGLEAAIAMHVTNNVVAFLLIAASGSSGSDGVDIRAVNTGTSWDAVVLQLATLLLYCALIAGKLRRLPESFTTRADEVQQHAPERTVSVEHADHRRHAEPLPPQ